jgi:aromatic-amino-acid transaminase
MLEVPALGALRDRNREPPRPVSSPIALSPAVSYLIPEARERAGDDPIFALNAEAQRRARSGEPIVNATLGALMEDDGRLAVMPSVFEAFAAVPRERAAAYAPIAGEPRYLAAVIRDLFGRSPLAESAVAVATPGGTGALHHAIVSFLEPGQALLTTEFYWGPYKTIADQTRRRVETFEMFDAAGRFNAAAFERALMRQCASQGRALVLLNSPCHNPTGYSLDMREWQAVAASLRAASRVAPVALLVDHAYARFGAAGSESWVSEVESLAGEVLLLAAWTASKSFAQYGSRIGALVAVHPDADERQRISSALGFACRGTWSNVNHLGMLAITDVLEKPELRVRADRERAHLVSLLGDRVATFNAVAKRAGLRYPRYEGGFFVTVFARNAELAAQAMRGRGVFVVPIQGALRIALCSTPARDVPTLVDAIVHGLHAAGG